MGLFSTYFKRSFGKFFDRRYYAFLKTILRYTFSGKNKPGSIRLSGFKIRYNDAKALMGMYQEIFYFRHYHFESDKKCPVIIDCGANIGLAALYFHSQFPDAVLSCIEADPEIAEILKENLTKNKCKAEIIQKAAWINSNEELSFGKAGADAGSLYATENTVKVKSMRLSSFLREKGEVDLLKIDIEGAEIDVLNDCNGELSGVKRIFVEFHSYTGKPQNLDELLSVLEENGFRYLILPARKMEIPFVNTRQNEQMDLQLNIFGFRI